ncbi:hypothetical protein JR316_0001503 [Psilocybe cubensis]|uniref:Uncharacterized protein n=2 Tax=Psilocybe cubensis TaxID=181762 RepID=A0A8H8CS66_PSICU|nr:hypothetical protein JR316_0001503 [Psilocybe cubensis]KAH9487428.1 hypothetical protein JR316_0001503 [Psilocybe cubensis]
MNTNTGPHSTPTASETGTKGSDFGNKIRGAVEVVHGAGENLRGTMLGAVDTMVHRGPTTNDDIAQQGRLEMERGLAHLRGPQHHPLGASSTHAREAPLSHSSTTTGVAGETPGTYGKTSSSIEATPGPTNTSFKGGETTYPSHHREDAIAGVPSPQLHEIQAMENHPNQAQNMNSEYDPSRAPYRHPVGHTDYAPKVPPRDFKDAGLGVGAGNTPNNRPVN